MSSGADVFEAGQSRALLQLVTCTFSVRTTLRLPRMVAHKVTPGDLAWAIAKSRQVCMFVPGVLFVQDIVVHYPSTLTVMRAVVTAMEVYQQRSPYKNAIYFSLGR